MRYKQEAVGKTLKAVVTLGAREGYNGKKEYSLEEVIAKLNEVNAEFQREKVQPINCMISQAQLVGRSGDTNYQEKLYILDFACSPRIAVPSKFFFLKAAKEYAFRLAEKMKQERVYLEFKGDTYVFKRE